MLCHGSPQRLYTFQTAEMCSVSAQCNSAQNWRVTLWTSSIELRILGRPQMQTSHYTRPFDLHKHTHTTHMLSRINLTTSWQWLCHRKEHMPCNSTMGWDSGVFHNDVDSKRLLQTPAVYYGERCALIWPDKHRHTIHRRSYFSPFGSGQPKTKGKGVRHPEQDQRQCRRHIKTTHIVVVVVVVARRA